MSRVPFSPVDDGKFLLLRLQMESETGPIEGLPGQRIAETMGTKAKFWIHNEANGQRALVKFARPGTGEHWSEKLAAEVAALLGVPHSPVEIGDFDGAHVSLTLGFLRETENLIHGNELLSMLDPSYSKGQKNYRPRAHTVGAVYRALTDHSALAPDELQSTMSAFGAFIGYLLLDALIGNVDRHHENWGLIHRPEGEQRLFSLSPSYDHASSLGRELRPGQPEALLLPSGRASLEGYLRRTFSKFFPDDYPELGQAKPLSTFEAFGQACALDPDAAHFWRGRLESLSVETLYGLPERVSERVMSPASKEFASLLLRHNYSRLRKFNP